ncbi:hypothetical protein PHLGIDRAFT_125100 [Phlebiopsis gigantea 11061_1 CR5-6]|uniref:Uncharacterized protein n=1 Tax=Phlebiopsis gigantea (strain 11061_1 CR5-6) TaxID=745531 RepID=A0A0C3P0D9_PHLG1|nr:hypothetical protein PHLGIDRAFT_125100 [Phlebiopsis gigantea 11061_1 CR5-6]
MAHTPQAVFAILADGLAVLLTWYTTKDHRKYKQDTALSQRSVVNVLINNGTMYFAVLFMLNLTQILTVALLGNEYLSQYIDFLGSLLVTRFMIDLRKTRDGNVPVTASQFAPEMYQVTFRVPELPTISQSETYLAGRRLSVISQNLPYTTIIGDDHTLLAESSIDSVDGSHTRMTGASIGSESIESPTHNQILNIKEVTWASPV